MRLYLVLGLALLASCSQSQTYSPDPGLSLSTELASNRLVVRLTNRSGDSVPASESYALAGSGGGNVVAFIVTKNGVVRPPCSPMDSRIAYWKPGVIGGHESRLILDIPIEQLVKLHCLKEDSLLVMAYQRPSGELLLSNSVELRTNWR
jgi:hypothetical protein